MWIAKFKLKKKKKNTLKKYKRIKLVSDEDNYEKHNYIKSEII